MGVKMLKVLKDFCNAFVVHGLTDGGEIWHIGAEQVISYFGELWSTFSGRAPNFGGVNMRFQA